MKKQVKKTISQNHEGLRIKSFLDMIAPSVVQFIRLPKAAPASTDALRIENELALCFNRADINPEYMKTLIMAAAAERYAGLNDPTPAHRRALLRQKLELEPENEETLWELFESAVTHVCIGKGGEISLACSSASRTEQRSLRPCKGGRPHDLYHR